MNSNGKVYIAYKSDPYSWESSSSAVYATFDLCLSALNKWKEEADAETDQFNGDIDDYQYDVFTITAYTLDCEGSGKIVYEVQGDVVIVDDQP